MTNINLVLLNNKTRDKERVEIIADVESPFLPVVQEGVQLKIRFADNEVTVDRAFWIVKLGDYYFEQDDLNGPIRLHAIEVWVNETIDSKQRYLDLLDGRT